MSTTERTRIICDRRGPYCQKQADFDGKPRAARTSARLVGWWFCQHPKMDVCPACQLGTSR